MRQRLIVAVLATLLAGITAQAQPARRTLEVGPGKEFDSLGAAAAAARDGDRVLIAAGLHQDCAVWNASNLLIEGAGPDITVIADRACQGKGLFVTVGANITVRNLTLARATVPGRNGAGIRAVGAGLTVENVTFEDNENGILAHPQPAGRILVRDSRFLRNGVCAPVCAHGIYVNDIALLRVERSFFRGTRDGHHIKSRARATEIVGNDIDDGQPEEGGVGTASYLIDVPHGGTVTISGNRLRKGPGTQNRATAIMIGSDENHHPSAGIAVRDNQFNNASGYPTALVMNNTATRVVLRNNRLRGPVTELQAGKPPP